MVMVVMVEQVALERLCKCHGRNFYSCVAIFQIFKGNCLVRGWRPIYRCYVLLYCHILCYILLYHTNVSYSPGRIYLCYVEAVVSIIVVGKAAVEQSYRKKEEARWCDDTRVAQYAQYYYSSFSSYSYSYSYSYSSSCSYYYYY